MRGGHLFVLLLLFAMLSACDGKPCSDPPDYEEIDEELVEKLDDMLDDADAYDHQRTRVLAINTKLAAARVPFRGMYEQLRVKMIDELVAAQPEVTRFQSLLRKMKSGFMKYVYAVIDASIPAHRFFTMKQRQAMTEDWEEPPDEYKVGFTTNRGIDYALLKISATDHQKALVRGHRDALEIKANVLLKRQHAVRMKLIGQWHQKYIDRAMVRRHIDEGAHQIEQFMYDFSDAVFDVTRALNPDQRVWTNKQVNKMRRCTQ